MGNCIQTASPPSSRDEQTMSPKEEAHDDQLKAAAGNEEVQEYSNMNSKKKARIKIVMRKEELEWVMRQLKLKSGSTGKRQELEHVLWELQRSREGKVAVAVAVAVAEGDQTWKPCLDTIDETECC